jgi:ribonuclease D
LEGLVDDRDGFLALCGRLAAGPVVAVDTEFHSERRFWPELFLVQVADSVGPEAVDPLSVGDLSPLSSVLTDATVVKVMHSARNDIHVLRHALGVEPVNVFDTQLAAAFLGYGEQCSLHNLLLDACGIRAKKAFCLSDWSRRPLAAEQLDYALDDVRYLLRLHARLTADLQKRGRMSWYSDEAARLDRPEDLRASLEDQFRKARSSGKLKKAGLPVLWRLVAWREARARELDRPRSHLAADSLLARLAAMAPESMDSLERLRGLPSGFLNRWGAEILEVVAGVVSDPPDDVPEVVVQRPDGTAAARADILRIFIKQKAHRMKIAPSLLLPRELLDSLAAMRPAGLEAALAGGLLTGWRMEALGAEIVSLLTGSLALTLNPSPSGGLRFVRVR